jgi:hypothetical protein
MYYASTNIFNKLTEYITNLVMGKKHFILALKRFLIIQSFHSINEFLDYQDEMVIDGHFIRKKF